MIHVQVNAGLRECDLFSVESDIKKIIRNIIKFKNRPNF